MARALLLATVATLLAAGIAIAEQLHEQPLEDAALAADDECAADAADGCGLNALQLRGKSLAAGEPANAGGEPANAGGEGSAPGSTSAASGTPDGTAPKAPPRKLCDPAIVQETCENINRLSPEFFNTAADINTSIVHAAELSEQLMVSRESVREFVSAFLGLINKEVGPEALAKGAWAVSCMELCTRTVQAVPESRRPPHSDLACWVPEGHTRARCDIDVSPEFFKDVQFEDQDPDEAKSKFHEQAAKEPKLGTNGSTEAEPHTMTVSELADLHYPKQSMDQLSISIANLFRVYPLINVKVSNNEDYKAMQEDGVKEAALEEVGEASGRGESSEWPFNIGGSGWDWDQWDSRRRRTSYNSGGGSSGATWQNKVRRVAAQAQAYTAGSLRSITSHAATGNMYKWFGSATPPAQQEMRRVISGVHNMLSNVDYVYPGEQCRDRVYAYVFPKPPANKNSRGQFVFHLCSLYMRSPLQEQIETLVHEGSHHQMMSTDDVCYEGASSDCRKAYGRRLCEALARKSPTRALKNADSFCYFVSDSHSSVGSVPTPAVPAPLPAPAPVPQDYVRRRRSWSQDPTIPPALVPILCTIDPRMCGYQR